MLLCGGLWVLDSWILPCFAVWPPYLVKLALLTTQIICMFDGRTAKPARCVASPLFSLCLSAGCETATM